MRVLRVIRLYVEVYARASLQIFIIQMEQRPRPLVIMAGILEMARLALIAQQAALPHALFRQLVLLLDESVPVLRFT